MRANTAGRAFPVDRMFLEDAIELCGYNCTPGSECASLASNMRTNTADPLNTWPTHTQELVRISRFQHADQHRRPAEYVTHAHTCRYAKGGGGGGGRGGGGRSRGGGGGGGPPLTFPTCEPTPQTRLNTRSTHMQAAAAAART